MRPLNGNDAPLRVEMATSDIEGGRAAAWADPDRVLGVVASSDPAGAFERFLLPSLLNPASVAADLGSALPEAARGLLAAFEDTHSRLCERNASGAGERHWIQVMGAAIEGQQLHVFACGAAWAFIIRDGRTHLVETGDPDPSGAGPSGAPPPALGREESPRISMLTLDLAPYDQVVLLTGGSLQAPDLRAVAKAFNQTQDLKRGCDGLVNLLGLQESSGAAVAFRVIPVTAVTGAPEREAAEEVFDELTAEVQSMSDALRRGESLATDEVPALPKRAAKPSRTRARARRASRPPATMEPWKPSYRRKISTRLPLLVWIILLAIISLAGIVSLSRPGRDAVRGGVRGLMKSDTPSDPATAAPVDTVEAGAPLDDFETPALPPLPAGMGLVRILPREDAETPVVWAVGDPERRPAPCDMLLQAGWERIYYEDEGVPLWSHKVLVQEGGTTWVRVEKPPAEGRAFLHVESFHLRDGHGMIPADGDAIFLDGRPIGRTPWEGEVDPGWHSVRVGDAEGRQAIEVFYVAGGQSRYFVPKMGLQASSTFEHTAPGRVLLQGPILLSVRISSPEGGAVLQPQLHLVSGLGRATDIPLAPVDPSRGLYVAAMDPENVRVGRPVRYYFSGCNAAGTPSTSELFALTPVSALDDPAPSP